MRGATAIFAVILLAAIGGAEAAGFSASESCVVSAPGSTTCGAPTSRQASSEWIIYVLVKDSSGSACSGTDECTVASADITATLGGVESTSVTCTGGGYCMVVCSATVAGAAELVVNLGGGAVSGSPYSVNITTAVDGGITSDSMTSLIVSEGATGASVSAYIYLKDAYGNSVSDTTVICANVSIVITSQEDTAVTVIPTCTIVSPGTYQLLWSSEKSGTWTMEGVIGSRMLSKDVVLTPGTMMASLSSISQTFVPRAGEDGTIAISAFDQYSNPVTTTTMTWASVAASFSALDGGDNSSVAHVTFNAVSYVSPGLFVVEFTTTRSGNFWFQVSVDGAVVGGAAAPFKVEPNLLHGTATQVESANFGSLSAGVAHTFKVTGVDVYGNVHSSGGVDLSAVLNRTGWTVASLASAVTVVKGTDGASSCTVTVTRTGAYTLALELTGDGLTTGGDNDVVAASPYTLTVSAEETTAASSISFEAAAASLTATAGVASAFIMQEVDQFGNLRSVSGEAFDVQLDLSGGEGYSAGATLTDRADGTYSVSMNPTRSGTYIVSVALTSGATLATNNFGLTVMPNNVSRHSTKQNYGTDYVDEGNSVDGRNSFAIKAKDAYGNDVSLGGAAAGFSLNISACTASSACIADTSAVSARTASAVLGDLGGGFYGVNYTTTVSGHYAAVVMYLGEQIAGSPFDLTVEAGTTNPLASVPFGSAASCSKVLATSLLTDIVACGVASATAEVSFGVRLVDIYGNARYQRSTTEFIKFSTISNSSLFVEGFNGSLPITLRTDVTAVSDDDGSYIVDFTTSLSGRYVSTLTHVKCLDAVCLTSQFHGDTEISGSPAAVFVMPAAPYAPFSSAGGNGLTTATAGIASEFLLLTRDRFMNNRVGVIDATGDESGWEIKLRAPDGQFSFGSVTGQTNGSFVCNFLVTLSGVYQLTTTLDAQPLSAGLPGTTGSPFALYLWPGIASSASYVVNQDVLPGRVSQEPIRVRVQAADKYGNLRSTGGDSLNVTIDALPLTAFSVTDHSNSSYDLGISVTKTGMYQAAIRVWGITVIGSPVTLNITSGAMVPTHSLVTFLSTATAGVTAQFAITARDIYHNEREVGGDAFVVSCTSSVREVAGLVQDTNNGKYLGLCVLTQSGPYAVAITALNPSKVRVHISGSPFSITVQPGPSRPQASSASGVGMTIATAGEWATFQMVARDNFFNIQTQGTSSDFILKMTKFFRGTDVQVPACPFKTAGASAAWGAVTSAPDGVLMGSKSDNGTCYSLLGANGTSYISYMWTGSGNYQMHVQIKDGDVESTISNGEFDVTIHPSFTDTKMSLASGSAYSIATVGLTMAFTVQTRDRFENVRDTRGSAFTAILDGPGGAFINASSLDNLDGKHRLTYRATVSGAYSIKVMTDGVHIQSSPANMSVSATTPNPAAFTAVGPGIVGGTIDQLLYVEVTTRDTFGNYRTEGGDDVRATAVGGWLASPDGFASPTTSVSGSVYDSNSGLYNITYTFTRSGSYVMDLGVQLSGDFTHVQRSPFTLVISPGAISAKDSVPLTLSASSPPLITLLNPTVVHLATAGAQGSFLILAKDRYGNPRSIGGHDAKFKVTMTLGATSIPCNVSYVESRPGFYAVSYPATVSGLYRVVSTYDGANITSHQARVFPAGPKAAFATVKFDAVVVNGVSSFRHTTAGVKSTFLLTARDVFHNVRSKGGDNLTVVVSPLDAAAPNGDAGFHGRPSPNLDNAACFGACAIDNADGTYTVSVTPTVSGAYQVAVFLDGEAVCQAGCADTLNSPYLFTTTANDVSPPLSIAFGVGLSAGVAGKENTFTVQSRDSWGNNRTHGAYAADGSGFNGEFFASQVKVGGALLRPDLCVCNRGICDECEVFDCQQNGRCSRPPLGYPKVTDLKDGRYTVQYVTTQAGDYTLAVSRTSMHIMGSPFRAVISADVTDPGTVMLTGDGLFRTAAGFNASGKIQVRDAFYNVRRVGGDVFNVLAWHKDTRQCTRAVPDGECLVCTTGDADCVAIGATIGYYKPLVVRGHAAHAGIGLYNFSYVLTVSGTYKLHMMLGGAEAGTRTFTRSPFTLSNAAGDLDPRASTVSGEGAGLATVQEEASLFLEPRDKFGNDLSDSRDSTQVNLCDEKSSCVGSKGGTTAYVFMSFFHYGSKVTYPVASKAGNGNSGGEVTPIEAEARPYKTGSTVILFTMNDVGKYQVNVEVHDARVGAFVPIQGSPFNMSVFPYDPDPSPLKCDVVGIIQIVAGTRGTGTISLRNQYGITLKNSARATMIEVSPDGANPSPIDLSLTNKRDGTFPFAWSVTASGGYSIEIRVMDSSGIFRGISGSPVRTRVVPDDTDPRSCVAFVANLRVIAAGTIPTYAIQSRDRFGNDQLTDPAALDSYEAYVTPSSSAAALRTSATINTVTEGSLYSAEFADAEGNPTLSRSGMYQIITRNLVINVINSPELILITAGAMVPSRCIVDARATQVVTAGVYSDVLIQARDRFDNNRTSGSVADGFILVKNETRSVAGAFSFKTRYEVEGITIGSFLTASKGLHTIHVLSGGVQLLESPFSVMVMPGVASAHGTFNATKVPELGTAGEMQTLTIQAADKYGNLHETGGEELDVSVKGLTYLYTFINGVRCTASSADKGSCVEVLDRGTGQYDVRFRPTIAGDYFIEARLRGKDGTVAQIGQPGTPSRSPWQRCITCVNLDFPDRECVRCLTLEVRPAKVTLAASTTYGAGASRFTSGKEVEFLVYARDAFGNIQTTGGLDMHVSIIGGNEFIINATVADMCDTSGVGCGQYTVAYTGTIAKTYAMIITLLQEKKEMMVQGFPASRADSKASGLPWLNADARQCNEDCPEDSQDRCCLMGEGASYSQSLKDTTFLIQARDKFGNDMTSGGENFEVEVAGPMLVNGLVEDLGSGQYVVKYKVLIPGTYVLSARLRRVHIGVMYDACPDPAEQCFRGSPMSELIIANPGTGLEGLVIDGPGNNFFAGTMGVVTIDVTDKTAQRIFGVSPMATALHIGTSRTDVAVNSTVNPWQLSFNVEQAGTWTLSITAGLLTHVVGSPFSITVLPDTAVVANTLVTGSGHQTTGRASQGGLVPGVAGILDKKLRLYIIPRDKFFNERTHALLNDNVRWGMYMTSGTIIEPGSFASGRRMMEPGNDHFGQYLLETTPITSPRSVGTEFSLEVTLSGMTITAAPMPIWMFPTSGVVDAAKSVAYGGGLRLGSAAQDVTFTIEARDTNGARLTAGGATFAVTFQDAVDVVTTATPVDNGDGTYKVTKAIKAAGFGDTAYVLNIKVGANSIAQTPFSLSVYPGAPLGSNTLGTASAPWMGANGLASGTTAAMANVILTLRDEYSNRVTVGLPLSEIKVVVTGVPYLFALINERYCTDDTKTTATSCQGKDFTTDVAIARVWHDNDGTYRVRYAATVAGIYNVAVSVSGARLAQSPWERQVRPSTADPTVSYAVGEALIKSTAGVVNYLSVLARDQFGNNVDKAVKVNATLTTLTALKRGTIAMVSFSEYEVQYMVTASGVYSLDLMVNELSLKAGPYSVTVYPGDTYYAACQAHISTLSPKAGFRSTFQIVAYDRFGNPRTVGGDDFRVTLSGPALVTADAFDWGNGTYSMSFFLEISGKYLVSGSLGVDAFLYIPALTCAAGSVYGPACQPNSPIANGILVGDDMQVVVQARDRFGSQIENCLDGSTIEVVSIYTDAGVTVSYNGTTHSASGVRQCAQGRNTMSVSAPGTFTGITLSGQYVVSVKIAGQHIFGSPFKPTVKAGYSAPRGCVAAGEQLSMGGTTAARKSVAGTEEVFSVFSQDAFGNRVSYDPFLPLDVFHVVLQLQGTACDTDGNPLDAQSLCVLAVVTNNMDSTHTVRYTPTRTGKFEVVARLVRDGQYILISNSPFTSTVVAGDLAVARTQAVNVPASVLPNRFTTFRINARDEFDNIISSPTVAFDAVYSRRDEELVIEPITADVVTNVADGSYEVGFIITASGTYHMDVTRSGERILDSFFTILAKPAGITYTECDVDGGGAVGGITGYVASFTIYARDNYGNRLTQGGNEFLVTIFPPGDTTFASPISTPVPKDNDDGSYLVKYTTTLSGTHKLLVASPNSELVRGGAYTDVVFMVDDKLSFPGRSVATGLGTTACFAGTTCVFNVQVRNSAGINRPFNDVELATSLRLVAEEATLTLPVTISSSGNGIYACTYTSEVAGEFELVVRFSGDHVQGSPFTVRMYPGPTDKGASLAFGGSYKSVVRQDVTFKIYAKDRFYNDQVYNAYDGADGFAVRLQSTISSYAFQAAITNNADGTYTASYSTTRSGAYLMYITLRGEAMNDWDGVFVSPDAVSNDACLLTGTGLRAQAAGEPGSVFMQARDLYGNPVQGGLETFNVTLLASGGALRHLGVGRHCDTACVLSGACPCATLSMGTYAVTYATTVAGNYKLIISRDAVLLPGVPFDIDITASFVNTAKTSINGCEAACAAHLVTCSQSGGSCAPCPCPLLATIEAGKTTTFTIQARDRFANAVTVGAKVFKIFMAKAIPAGKVGCYITDGCVPASLFGTLEDNDDGSYAATLDGGDISVPGAYLLSITRQNEHVQGSPFAVSVLPGAAATGGGASVYSLAPLATAGTYSTFTVVAKDQFSNALVEGGERFTLLLSGVSEEIEGISAVGSVEDEGDGTYFAAFKVERAGSYELTVSLDGTNIAPGVTTIIVLPATVDPAKSSVDGTGLDSLQPAGDQAYDLRFIPPEIKATPRDRFGNIYSFAGLPIRVTSVGPVRDGKAVTVSRDTSSDALFQFFDCGVGCADTAYVFSNPLTVSGAYTIDVMLDLIDANGVLSSTVPLLAAPISVQVIPASTAAHRSTFSTLGEDAGALTSGCAAVEKCTFQIQAIDLFGNMIDQQGDVFEVMLIRKDEFPEPNIVYGSVGTAVDGNGNLLGGKYDVVYQVTRSGQYVLQVARYGVNLIGSPVDVVISPGPPVASSTILDGLGTVAGVVGQLTTFTVIARDLYGNVAPLPSIYESLTVTTDKIGADQISKSSLSGGKYLVKFPIALEDDHVVTVRALGALIMGSPLTLPCEAAIVVNPDYRFCTVDAPTLTTTTGVAKTININPRNNAGLLTALNGAKFEAQLGATTCTLCSAQPAVLAVTETTRCCVNNNVDPPTVTYVSRKAGTEQMAVTMNRPDLTNAHPHIFGSPFTVAIQPAPTSAAASGIEPLTLTTTDVTTAGFPSQLALIAKDVFGNQQMFLSSAIGEVAVTTTGPSSSSTAILDRADGTFALAFLITRAGEYKMDIQIAGALLGGALMPITVNPDAFFVRASTIAFGAWGVEGAGVVAVAGAASANVVQGRDTYGNALASEQGVYNMNLTGEGLSVVRSFRYAGDGQFDLVHTITASGTYSLSIFGLVDCTSSLDCDHVARSPFRVEVVPAAVAASNCAVYGAGVFFAVASSDAGVFILPRDLYGNQVMLGISPADFNMTLTSSADRVSSGLYQYTSGGATTIVSEGVVGEVSSAGLQVTYTAQMPGEYEMVIMFQGEVIGGTSGTTCGVGKPCPMVAQAYPPTVVKSQFSDSGGHVYVSFQEQTNNASKSGVIPCGVVFEEGTVATFAANPEEAQCTFLTTQLLDITLGFGATVLINDDLEWLPENLRLRAVCLSGDEAHICFENSLAIAGAVRVERPADPATPTPIFKAPGTVGPCDGVTLDGAASYGSMGRALKFYFGMQPGSTNDQQVRTFLLGQISAPFTSSAISLPPGLLAVGQTYTFMVRVVNFMDAASTGEVTVEQRAVNGPAMFIEGPNTMRLRTTQAFRLRGSATLSSCFTGPEEIDFTWNVASDSTTGEPALALNAVTRETRTLYVPPLSLTPGVTYTFSVVGSMRSKPGDSGVASVSVYCEFAPLVARIVGGDRSVAAADGFTLDATESVDLDGIKSVVNFGFRWWCATPEGRACFDDVEGILSTDQGSIHLPPSSLVPGVYLFTVQVSKEPGPRVSSATSTMYVLAADQLDIQVEPLKTAKVNSNDRLVLSGLFDAEVICPAASYAVNVAVAPNNATGNATAVIDANSNGNGTANGTAPGGAQFGLRIKWSQTKGENVLVYPSLISTPVTLQNLAFSLSALVPGSKYRFRLAVACLLPGVVRAGLGEIVVLVNTAPSSGQFQVGPMAGTASSTPFTLEMLNWVDDKDDMPFRYEFRYATTSAPEKEIPLGSVDSNWIDTVLPGPSAGTAQHNLTLVGYVLDIYEGSARATVAVEVVSMSNSTPAARRAMQDAGGALLNTYVATGNVEGIIAMTISLATEDGLACARRDTMIVSLQAAADKLVMKAAEVTGFASAVKAAQAAVCTGPGGRREHQSDHVTDGTLSLVAKLTKTSGDAGLESTANQELGGSLSDSLKIMAVKNGGRRALRRLLDVEIGHTSEIGRFFRGAASAPPSRRGDRRADAEESQADVLTGTVKNLQEAQTNKAVPGEDSQRLDTESIQMNSQLSSAADLAGSTLTAGGSSFETPSTVLGSNAGGGVALKAKNSNYNDSPYDSDAKVGGVASCDLGYKVENLKDPICIGMAATGGPPDVPQMQSICLSTKKVYDGMPQGACAAACPKGLKGCEKLGNPTCAGDAWGSCVDATLDTCRFWNSDLNDWDGEGCIVNEIVQGGGLKCHCYHLTDFGGALSSAMPNMNVVDPTNPGALFKNLGADKILVICIIIGMLLLYWSLCYWGWRKDQVDNNRSMDSLSQENKTKQQERRAKAADTDEALLAGNNFKLMQGAMKGKLSRSIMLIKSKVTKQFMFEHKLFSSFNATRTHYTRPRRFTVLFCMVIGNMFISAVFAGTENSTFITKIIMGVVAGIIMLPATFFFKQLFMSLDVDPRTKERWEQEAVERARQRNAELATTITVGPTASGIAAPPVHMRGDVPKRMKRGFVPHPDQVRMGMAERFSTITRNFRRRPARRMNDDFSAAVPAPQPLGALPSVGENASDDSNASSHTTYATQGEPLQEVGAYIPRRALPVRKGVRPPAPTVLSPTSSAANVLAPCSTAGGSGGDGARPLSPTDTVGTRGTVSSEGSTLHRQNSGWVRPEEEEEGMDRTETLRTHEVHSKKEVRALKGRARFEAAIATKIVNKLSTQDRARTGERKKKLLDHKLQYGAYLVAFLWYMTCCYFCMLYGLTFTTEIEQAWLISFFISIMQDLLISETMMIAIKTTVMTILLPNIAGFLAGRIANKYK